MIHLTSVPYVIETYDVVVTSLYADGTPKEGTSQRSKKIDRFPQDVIDRVYALTDNLRFRRFVRGVPLTGVEWSWLFICFENPLPYCVASDIRDNSGLDSEHWGFYTFDEERLKELRSGGSPPDVNVFAFSDIDSARIALIAFGSDDFLGAMNFQPTCSYFIFAKYESHLSKFSM